MQLGAMEDNKYLYVNAGNIVSIVHTGHQTNKKKEEGGDPANLSPEGTVHTMLSAPEVALK